MISSKALLDQTGISRATLNNYIRFGILPRPEVLSAAQGLNETAPRLLGYFPEDSIERVKVVQCLKAEGLSIAEIVEYLDVNGVQSEYQLTPDLDTNSVISAQEQSKDSLPSQAIQAPITAESDQPHGASLNSLPNISLGDHQYPAYMVNYNLELTWFNDSARENIFGFLKPPSHSNERNLFLLLTNPEANLSLDERRNWANLHVQIASARVSHEALLKQIKINDPALASIADTITWPAGKYQQDKTNIFNEIEFYSNTSRGKEQGFKVYSVYFREGVLIVHAPLAEIGAELINYLSRRNQVIQSLLSQQLPVMTPLAVLVADIQKSVRICSELPPDEYFELINQIWHTMSQILRKFNGTHGKHAGDGAVYYFFPQTQSNYLFNVICCAEELRTAMAKINLEWKLRKNWLTELKLNIGLHEGQEWLGAFRSDQHVELIVLGDTINHAARLSDFAKHGSIWATKNLISRLSVTERKHIDFGVLRLSAENGDRFVESSYAQINSLVEMTSPKYEKLRDIAQLAVAEIRSVQTTPSPARLHHS